MFGRIGKMTFLGIFIAAALLAACDGPGVEKEVIRPGERVGEASCTKPWMRTNWSRCSLTNARCSWARSMSGSGKTASCPGKLTISWDMASATRIWRS